jgi:hypothetical protein
VSHEAYLAGTAELARCAGLRPKTIIGLDAVAFDIATAARQMDSLKVVPVGVAKALLKGGQNAINWAIAGAVKKINLSTWFPPALALQIAANVTDLIQQGSSLPGATNRSNVYWKLQWHQNALKTAGADSITYTAADDLKKWVMQAFIEANAVAEGTQVMGAAWSDMWTDAYAAIAAMPAQAGAAIVEVRKQVGDIVNNVVESGTGIPLWGWALIGGVTLGGVIYVASKVLIGVAPVAAAAYLPPRRF